MAAGKEREEALTDMKGKGEQNKHEKCSILVRKAGARKQTEMNLGLLP